MTKDFEDVIKRMLDTPPLQQKDRPTKSEMLNDLREDSFVSGDKIPHSGIYLAEHEGHAKPHEVTCLAGSSFPACKECESVKFTLVQAATNILKSKYFKGNKG